MKQLNICLILAPTVLLRTPPIGIAVLKSTLKEQGYITKAFDFSIKYYREHKFLSLCESWIHYLISSFNSLTTIKYANFLNAHLIPDKYINSIMKTNSNVLCFSIYRTNVLVSLYLAKEIKKRKPTVRVIFGGPSCSSKKIQTIIKRENVVDDIIVSEGEIALLKVLQKKSNPNKIINIHGPRDLNQQLNPDYSDFNMKYYGGKFNYSASRGCPGNCSFCFERKSFGKFRYKFAKNVIQDLIDIKKKYNPRSISFTDLSILGTKDNLENFCELAIKNELHLFWGGFIRPSVLNEEILNLMFNAGCRWLNFGIESGSKKILKHMKKDFNLKQAEFLIKNASNIGIKVNISIVVGYPTESWDDFYYTLKYIWRNRSYINEVHCFTACLEEGTTLTNLILKLKRGKNNPYFWSYKNNNIIIRIIRWLIVKLLCFFSIKK
ncbi:radical SAM protein [Candidatus Woesearchaeota archaeon]|mgnify:CR=1 FL=1|jgi:anaerobic magnesium-protoporphyrin IX monomethyl ester cyclase|nr:radical SAM protein [Candidatus Woesearchaeota archaeon]